MTLRPFSELIKVVRQQAEENPDRVSESTYFKDDGTTPMCIYGHAFSAFGARRDSLSTQVVNAEGVVVVWEGSAVASVHWRALGFRSPGRAQSRWAAEVQENQDGFDCWEVAVQGADKVWGRK